ncbi:MAG: hypothetical protein U9O94_07155 [Nanoarchaeota archaeon]|nr:hypothetical protein [Nanoarchaeota archaeon]
MADSIDDVIEEKPKEKAETVEELLKDEKAIHSPEWYDKPRSILGKIWDVTKYAAMMGGMALSLSVVGLPAATMVASTYISAFGLSLGSLYDNHKKKIKNTWRRFYKEFGFGSFAWILAGVSQPLKVRQSSSVM